MWVPMPLPLVLILVMVPAYRGTGKSRTDPVRPHCRQAGQPGLLPAAHPGREGLPPTSQQAHNADYALLRAALGHQRDDSQISLFWLSREGRTALQVRAMEGGSQV
jgi:hypothetical protein